MQYPNTKSILHLQNFIIFSGKFVVMFTVTLHRWQIAILIYVTFVGLLVTIRPALMFDLEKNAKVWGLDMERGVSMFSPMFVFPFLALLSYYFASLIDLAYSK
jgi:hypothetical protein